MTLPAWRDERPEFRPRPRPRKADALDELRDRSASPANQLLELLEASALPGQEPREAHGEARPFRLSPLPRRLASYLLGWSLLALALSVSYLAYETLVPGNMPEPVRPSLDFADVSSRFVQSSEGPALELTGLVRNEGDATVEPEVVLQLAGSRVAIEEPLRLGTASLPPGAERPFTVRVLLPEGTKSVRLLPTGHVTLKPRALPLVSPAWTADAGR